MKDDSKFFQVEKLSKDLKDAIMTMDKKSVQYLVKTYYTIQEERIAMYGRVRELSKDNKPNLFYDYMAHNMESLENRVKNAFKAYVSSSPVGEWLMSICGIAEVISAGLLSSLNINLEPYNDADGNLVAVQGRHPTSFVKICGMAPGQKRERGKKCDYNPDLKRLMFIIGESFVKVQNLESDYYGKRFANYKRNLTIKNDNMEFSEDAKQILIDKKFSKTTEAYKHLSEGKLPPAHIHARARRWICKIFLTHLWQVMYFYKYNKTPPMPWIMLQPGHTHFIDMPNKPFNVDGEREVSTVKKSD